MVDPITALTRGTSIQARLGSGWDESKHPRVPGGSGDLSGEFTSKGGGAGSEEPTTGPWAATEDEVAVAIQEHMDSADLQTPHSYGLRVDEHVVKVGETLPDSRRWENGDPLDEALSGTSVLNVSIDYPRSIKDALNKAKKYYGRTLSLVVADGYPEPGEDEGEGLLASPKVLKTWRHA